MRPEYSVLKVGLKTFRMISYSSLCVLFLYRKRNFDNTTNIHLVIYYNDFLKKCKIASEGYRNIFTVSNNVTQPEISLIFFSSGNFYVALWLAN